jgi:hypothetical protein
MELDGNGIFRQVINNISFSKSRNFYHHVNYGLIRERGERFHKLYVDEGNELDFYTTNDQKGIMLFEEPCEHQITIAMYDSYRNESILSIPVACTLLESENLPANGSEDQEIELNSYAIIDNTLVIYADQSELSPEEEKATYYYQGQLKEMPPSYFEDQINVFLWDLHEGIPDSVNLCNSSLQLNLEAMVPSGVPYKFYSNNLDATLSARSLFDTVYLHSYYQPFMDDAELFVFGHDRYPIRSNIEVKLKPLQEYEDKERSHVYSVDDSGNFGFAGGNWDTENMVFETRNFGAYTILTDSIAPSIKPLIINRDRLVFTIKDDLSGIKEFNMHVDGQWILMNYEPKKNQIWSEKLIQEKPFEGPIVLSVVDNAGNEKLYKSNLAKHESENR